MMLSAGATVPYKSDDTYTFTYNIIEFDWDEEIDGLSVTIHPRAWNSQRTCFEDDHKRLGGKRPNFRLACPSFRKVDRPTPEKIIKKIDSLVTESLSLPAVSISEVASEEAFEGMQAMQPMEQGYELARLRFFRDLFEIERLRILVNLNAIPENFNERMSKGIERRLFDMLVRNGRLSEIEQMIKQLIEERKDGVK